MHTLSHFIFQANYIQFGVYREGRDEMGIQGVKKVMVSMRRDQQYRKAKLRLIHKIKGLEFVRDGYKSWDERPDFWGEESDAEESDDLDEESDNGETDISSYDNGDWFKGYHVYRSRQEVMNRLQQGKPLSCFCLDGDKDSKEVHVAFTQGEKRNVTVSYLTLMYDTDCSRIETGMHFCSFYIKPAEGSSHQPMVTRIEKKELKPVDYALMLPYIANSSASSTDEDFFQQYTLVYSDWEVLRCTGGQVKGRVPLDEQLFRETLDLDG